MARGARRVRLLDAKGFPAADTLRAVLGWVTGGGALLDRAMSLDSIKGGTRLTDSCVIPDAAKAAGSFVVWKSKERYGKRSYIRVQGRRTHPPSGMKKTRKDLTWPRTGSGRLRIVRLHRWICAAVHGPPPSKEHEATHICGNSECICASHIRWQPKPENREDVIFHAQPCRAGTARKSW